MRRLSLSCFTSGLLASTLLGTIFCAGSAADEPSQQPAELAQVDYVRDIRPILSDNCYVCHGPNAEDREADLRLDAKDSAMGESASGALAIVPGKPEESELLLRITSEDEDALMPPADTGKSLKPEQVELIRRWIQQGADWQEHWSFVPLERPQPLAMSDEKWARNAIDSFVLSRLDQEGLKPSSEASKETLLRRVTFDLTGLPPTLDELDAFLSDDSPNAYELAVDRLLHSPHYGEHMARFWLDAARYGDTHGLHLDNYREIWPYRDWVVRAFNNNMPYDQFTVEQLAGDLLPNASLEQRVATGFCRCNVSTSEGGSIEEEVYTRNVIDRVTTMGTVFLGLTLECSRCHDHKFDPLTMHDFYSLFAFFNSIDGPALDGNVGDTQPSEPVPTAKQAETLEQTSRRIVELQSQQEAHRQGMESVFQLWAKEQRQHLSSGGPPVSLPTCEGLTGHYSFDLLAEGKVANHVKEDSFGQAHNDPKTVQGQYGNGIEISAEAYVDLGNVFEFEINEGVSFGIWVNVPKDGSGAILAKIGKHGRGYALKAEKGQVALSLINIKDKYAIEVVTADKVLTPDAWHHVMVTNDKSTKATGVALYVDGKKQSLIVKRDTLTNVGQSPRTIKSSADPLLIGRLESEQQLVGGKVDDLRFYDRQLTPSEVLSAMLVEGIEKLLAQDTEQLTPEQIETLRLVYFNNFDSAYAEIVNQAEQLIRQRIEVQKNVPISLIWRERKEPRDAFILNRGEYDQKGGKVGRATPAAFAPLPENAPRNRLSLARWLVDRQNPLTARVAVNRFWAQAFGTGLVKTAEDFGSQGEVPSHPKLLDWLAVELIESGWDVKALMKTIVLSSTYRQSSLMTPELIARDPGNRLLAHGPRFRLDAEMLRDQALAVSGLLVKKLGGPSVKPPQPDGLWFSVGYSGSNTVRFKADTGAEKVHRRTLYTFVKRTSPPPQMSTFDGPSREACAVRRERTNTPLQALLMLNDPQYIEAARALAERAMQEGGTDSESRIRMMVRLSTARQAKQATVDELLSLYQDQLEQFKNDTEAAKSFISVGPLTWDESLDTSELASWTMVANVVLNLDEVVNKN